MSKQAGTNPFVFYGFFSAAIVIVSTVAVYVSADVSLLLGMLIGINVAAIMSMGLDKSLAQSSSLRIPEVVLYVQALLGGAPGILLGIHVFKHKTRKAGFQFVLLLIVVAQVALLRLLDIEVRPDNLYM